MSARKRMVVRHMAEVARERNALLKCVERMAAELDRMEANGADDAMAEDARNTVRWCKVREKARRRDNRQQASYEGTN